MKSGRSFGITIKNVCLPVLAFLLIAFSSCGGQNDATASNDAEASNLHTDTVAKATLLFAGDAMQHQGQFDRARQLGAGKGYDFSECFTLVAPMVQEADYAVVNLEVSLGGGTGGYSGFPCFSAPDSFAKALKDAGFDLFLTANNHTLDRRDAGLRRTLVVLDSLRADHTGTFSDVADRKTKVPFIKGINGIKVAFLNYTYGTNGIEARQGAEVSLIDREKMAHEIKLARQRGAELVCVCVHWGVEYVLKENASQRSLADFLLAQGVDMVIGGHPHVVQPMHMVWNKATSRRALVVYSLGNFISNMKTGDTRGGALVTVHIERTPDGVARVSDASWDLIYAAKPSGASDNYRVIPGHMEAKIPPGQMGWWRTFAASARRAFAANDSVPATQH